MKRRLLYLAFGWGTLCSILSSALLLGSAGDGTPGSLIARVTLAAESQRPSAIAFDARGDLAIVMAPFGDLSTRDGRTLIPRRGVMHRAESPPISPVSLAAAPNGTLYAAGYMQQIARSRLGNDGQSGPMGPWLGRAELGTVAPIGLALDSSGDLFATDMGDGLAGNQGVVRIDRETGAIEVLVAAGGGGLQSARALAFDALDRLYVADLRAGAVLRFARGTGELDRVVVLPTRARGTEFVDLEIGPLGRLYVLDSARGEVLRFNLDVPGASEVLIDLSAETAEKAIAMAVSPSGDIVVLTGGRSELLLYAGDGPGAAPGSQPVTARAGPRPGATPAPAAPVTAGRPATRTSQRLHLRVEPSAGAGYRKADRGILLREIYRQGLALAALDHVGAVVRDQALGEASPAGALELVASVLALPGKTVRLSLAAPAASSVPLWSQDLPVGDGKRIDYLEAVAEVERLVRDRWPTVLRELGLERSAGEPAQDEASAQAPPAADQLDLLTQLSGLRSAHRRLGAAEEESLEQLALGYANLGFLTGFQWSSANESLRARSLLYAERLAAGRPSPRALRVRAYARALAGFHAAALSDLAEADTAPAAFGWQEVIEAYCHSDFERLAQLATESGEVADLAGRLAFRVIAGSDSTVLMRRTAEAVLVSNPRAWEVYAGLGLAEGFGLRSMGSVALRQNLAELGERLSSAPGLPTNAQPPGEPSALTEVLESLKRWWGEVVSSEPSDSTSTVALQIAHRLESLSGAAAADEGQPSWQALAHLLGETLFAQIERQVGFERFSRSVDVGGLLEFLRPLWRDHPLAGLVEIYGIDPRLDRELFDGLISGLEIAQPRPELKYLRTQLKIAGDRSPAATMWSELGLQRSALDETADDLRILLDHSYDASSAHRLQRVSPDSPAALAALIRWDWPAVADRAEGWQAEPVHPQISRELADRYRRVQQPEDAVAVLERYVAEIPDSWAYTELAAIHADMGNVDEWRRTQEDFLATTADEGLAHDRARERLAWHYNQRGEFSKARPYADRAAVSGAIWALRVAAWTHEGLGDWKEAEKLHRKVSQRYDSARIHWYFWCRRTGRGDLDAARRLAESAIPDRRAVGGGSRVEVGVFLLLEGELEAAAQEFRTVFESTGNPLAGLHLAFTLFDLGRPEAADVLEQVSERGPAFVEKEYVLGELLEVTAASRRLLSGELTPEAHRVIVDGILASVDERWRSNADYFLGRFLQTAAAEPEARKFLGRSSEAYHLGMWNSTLAAARLRQLD